MTNAILSVTAIPFPCSSQGKRVAIQNGLAQCSNAVLSSVLAPIFVADFGGGKRRQRSVGVGETSRIRRVGVVKFGEMYYFRASLLWRLIMEMANNCQVSNVVCDGSPSRIRRVRRISLGITTRPRSSHYVKKRPKEILNPENP